MALILLSFCLEKGYIVHGIKRRSSSFNTQRIDHIYQDRHLDNNQFILHYGDLTDSSNIIRIIKETKPDEIYNLGATKLMRTFDSPEYTTDVDAMGTLRILEAIRLLGLEKKTRFYQEYCRLYGQVQETPQTEKTPFYLEVPMVFKILPYWITVNYLKPMEFMLVMEFYLIMKVLEGNFCNRKITRGSPRMSGPRECLYLGNLEHLEIGVMQKIMLECSG